MLLLGRGIGQLQPDSRGLLLLDGLEAEYVAFLLALAQEVGREVNLKVVTVEAELPQQDFCCLLCYLYPFQQPDLKLLHRPILLNHPYAGLLILDQVLHSCTEVLYFLGKGTN